MIFMCGLLEKNKDYKHKAKFQQIHIHCLCCCIFSMALYLHSICMWYAHKFVMTLIPLNFHSINNYINCAETSEQSKFNVPQR